MNERESKKNKHMTMEERQEIQECLDKGTTFKAIARRIGKDQTTVSREVKRHIVVRAGGNTNIPDELCPNLRKAILIRAFGNGFFHPALLIVVFSKQT